MCSLSSHAIMFYCTIFMVIFFGSISGYRYMTFRTGTCSAYVNCDNGQCVTFKDKMGNAMTKTVEDSNPRPDLSIPVNCWSNGDNATFNNPYSVMVWLFFAIAVIDFIYILISIVICSKLKTDSELEVYYEFKRNYNCCYTDEDNMSKKNTSFCQDMWCSCNSNMVYVIIGFMFVGYIAAISVFANHYLEYRKVTCLNYADELFNSVNAVDDQGISGKYSIDGSSYRPNILPATCWLNAGSVTFYATNDFAIYGSIVFFGGCAMLIFSLLIFACFREKRRRDENSKVATPTVQFTTTSCGV